MSTDRVSEIRDKLDPLNEPIYAIFYTKYDGTGHPKDAFLSFRRDYFKNGKRTLRIKKKAVLKGFPGEIKGKIAPHSIKWKIKMGSTDIEQSYHTKNGYIIVKRGYNKSLKSRIYFNKNHEWQKSEYFKPATFDTSKPQIVLSPVEWRSKIELQEFNEETSLYKIKTLYPLSYHNSSPSQNVVDTIYGKPTLVLYSESGVYCYCTEENAKRRLNAMEEINQNLIFMSSSWQADEGQFQPEEEKEESSEQAIVFKDMQHAAEIQRGDEVKVTAAEEGSVLEIQTPEKSEDTKISEMEQDDSKLEGEPKLENITDSSMDGSKEMTDGKTMAEYPKEVLPDISREETPDAGLINEIAEGNIDIKTAAEEKQLEEAQAEEASVEPAAQSDFHDAEAFEPHDIIEDAEPDKPEEADAAEPESADESPLVYIASHLMKSPAENEDFSAVDDENEDIDLDPPTPETEELSAPEATDADVESAFGGDFEYPAAAATASSLSADEVLAAKMTVKDDLQMPEITSELSDLHSKPKCENWEDGHVRIAQDGITAYEGDYKDGKRHGFGSYYYRDGMLCYAGFWNEGEKEGLGVSFRHDDQALHVSNWRNNQPVGFVSLFDPNGNFKFGGKMTEGKKDGVGISYDNDEQTVFVGKWKNGEYTGYGSVFDENGLLMYSGMWKDGQRHGTGTSFDQNGAVLFSGEWRDGLEDKGILFKHIEPRS